MLIVSKVYWILFFLIFIPLSSCYADIQKNKNIYNNGLYFYSHEVPKEDRTSLYIPIGKIGNTKDEYSINFDFKIRESKQSFGYIFRLIGRDNINLDFIISDMRTPDRIFVVYKNKSIIQLNSNDLKNLDFEKWNSAKIAFVKNRLSVTVNDVTRITEFPTDKFHVLDLYFGANNHPMFLTTDVPPLTLKNIRILTGKDKEIRCWTLDKHGENVAYDEYKQEPAMAVNPLWEIDCHYHWKKNASIIFERYPQIAFDPIEERLFIAQADKMLVYNVMTNKVDTVQNIKGSPYYCTGNQLIFDTNNSQLISYNFDSNTFASFNFKTKSWDNNSQDELGANFGQHSKYFMQEDSILVTVGGYGFHKYKGVMMKYPFAENKWESVDISKTIYPRYLGSMGYWGDGKFLYYGGYGSESGKQEEYPRNYYDLYQIDVHNDSIRKLWGEDLELHENQYTNSNSMVIEKNKNVFYVLAYEDKYYNTIIQLQKINIDGSACQAVGDTIHYLFRDNRSYCDLYLCSKSKKLLAITAYTSDNEKSSKINIYTINDSPYAKEEIFQEKASINPLFYFRNILIALIVVALLVVIFCFKYYQKKGRNKNGNNKQSHINSFSIPAQPVDLEITDETSAKVIPSSIQLLGGFRIIDINGDDITKNFSPLVKYLFLVIILSTYKNKTGISSTKLKDILWPDKDSRSARNNRNVNLSKLRPLLQRLGNVEINEEDNHWTLISDKSVCCDYQVVMAICTKISSGEELNVSLANDLLRIASKGTLLPDIHEDWLDSFKSEYSVILLETLLKISAHTEIQSNYDLLYKIGDIILMHDNIDEDGIRLKCYSLYHSNKKGNALKLFSKFCEAYKGLLGEEYKGEFNDLVKDVGYINSRLKSS